MTFRREKIKDYFLLDTSVENLFINEYMAAAPGDFVKVYLFAQMYADLGQEITNEEIAKYLSMEHEDVLRAWTYWEKMGVIRKIRRESADKFDYDVEFVLLKEQFYGDKESKRPVGLDQSMQAVHGRQGDPGNVPGDRKVPAAMCSAARKCWRSYPGSTISMRRRR